MSKALEALSYLRPDPPIELRALAGTRMEVRRFDSHAEAAAWAEAQDQAGARAVYVVMNPFDPAAIRGSAVDDGAVLERQWLLIDVDPVRPKDANSNAEELAAAELAAAAIREELTEIRGWPTPLQAMSGNGHHLLYRIRLPNDSGARELVNGVLVALAGHYSDDRVQVDTSVGNAARITKLYGTMTRKAPATPERPHRRSVLLDPPEEAPRPVRLKMLLEAAGMGIEPGASFVEEKTAPPAPPKQQEAGIYDLAQVLSRVTVLRSHTKDGTEFRDIICPWAHEHSSSLPDTATVITKRLDNGGLGFKCLHEHCSGRTWKDLRDVLGLETVGQRGRRQAGAAASSAAAEPPSLDKLAELRAKRVTVCDARRFAKVADEMDYYADHKRMPDSIATGIPKLDRLLLGGWRPGKFYVVGGESGRGKTSLLMQWAVTAAEQFEPQDRCVAIVTPEMGPESLDVRTYALRSARSLSSYKEDKVGTREAWDEKRPPQNIRASFNKDDVETFVEDENPAMLIVDYAQQAVSYTSQNRHTELAELGDRCIRIAQDRNIPVIIGSQVNVDKDRDFSIRETRILEHQADAMIFIDVTYEKDGQIDSKGAPKIKESWLRLHKHRHGPGGKVKVIWHRELFRFDEDPFGEDPHH